MAGKRIMQLSKDYVSDFYKSGKWIIEIVTLDGQYEFWLGYENYGLRDMIFGCSMENTSSEEFLDMVEKNLYREKVNFAYWHEEDMFEI